MRPSTFSSSRPFGRCFVAILFTPNQSHNGLLLPLHLSKVPCIKALHQGLHDLHCCLAAFPHAPESPSAFEAPNTSSGAICRHPILCRRTIVRREETAK